MYGIAECEAAVNESINNIGRYQQYRRNTVSKQVLSLLFDVTGRLPYNDVAATMS